MRIWHWCQNSNGKCLKYDVRVIRLASLAAKWLQISKIDRRILVALIEFHKGIYAVYAVSTMRWKYSHIKKRSKSLNWVREYTGTKLTSTLFTIDGVVIVTPTHQYRLQPCVFNIYISGSLVWSKWERQKHVIQAWIANDELLLLCCWMGRNWVSLHLVYTLKF